MTEAVEETTEESAEPNQISVTSKKTGRSVTFTKSFGDSLEDASAQFGADVVFSGFVQQATIRVQGKVRLMLDKGATEDEATAAGEGFIPGVITRTHTKVDPIAALAAKVSSGELSKDDLRTQLEAALADLGG
jgi:translation initiation factor 1 (eIF-1/SUI1)